jgi:hypothetical protein
VKNTGGGFSMRNLSLQAKRSNPKPARQRGPDHREIIVRDHGRHGLALRRDADPILSQTTSSENDLEIMTRNGESKHYFFILRRQLSRKIRATRMRRVYSKQIRMITC